MTNELGEASDLADERESEEYQAMLEEVEAEMMEKSVGWIYGSHLPDGRSLHDEAMRRLREKYESACGED